MLLPRRSLAQLCHSRLSYQSASRTQLFRPHGFSTSTSTTISSERPPLPQKTQQLSLFDSLSEKAQTLPPCSSGGDDDTKLGLAWYTCGPTTYAPAHLGHARTYVWLDIIRRVLEEQTNHEEGRPPPLFVMNITDVDDKILAAAAEQDMDPIDLARKYEAEFWKDLDALHCLRPHIVTRVTEHVESQIVPFIARLMDRGMAYELPDGVYFSVQAYNDELGAVTKYGKLAPATAANERIEITSPPHVPSSGDKGSRKKDPRDFVLWKRKKPLEALAWPSPWGEGRPGWHIECSAMIEAVQSQFRHTHRFMVHAGGIDLKFPHHTNEIAQSEAYRGTGEWIPHWVHTGHLHIDGLKMSKSLKNFVSIQDFLGEYTAGTALESPGDDFRIWCLGLSGSYRGPATFCTKTLDEAKAVRQQILRFLLTAQSWVKEGTLDAATRVWQKEDVDLYVTCQESRVAGMRALRNDMDGAEYLKSCLRIVTTGNLYISNRGKQTSPVEPLNEALSTLCKMLELVGVSERTTRASMGSQDVISVGSPQVVGGEASLIDELVNFRSSVRRAALQDVKSGRGTENTALILELSDRLRNEDLPSIGIELQDERAENGSDSWRFCIPRVRKLGQKDVSSTTRTRVESNITLEDVAPEDFFRVGRYKGLFSKFNAEGIPTHNTDGSEVSIRTMKKLLKKRDTRQAKQ